MLKKFKVGLDVFLDDKELIEGDLSHKDYIRETIEREIGINQNYFNGCYITGIAEAIK